MKKLKNYVPILLMVLCAVVFGTLLATGVIDLDTIPDMVQNRPVAAVLLVLLLYAVKGCSAVIIHNALVIVVSLIFDLPAAIILNSVGTAVCLSVSYWVGRFTKTDSLDAQLGKHPKLKRYFDATRSYGFVSCFAIHMLGLNLEVLGVLLGMMHIPYLTYLSSSLIAILPGMICLTIMGGELSLSSPAFWIILAIDIPMILFGFIYTKRKITGYPAGEKKPPTPRENPSHS
ncbi:MAG: VTT domain-containing protein [Clostridiales bacterium]|nr:VTT domain-containing protein [Clostridiales bacterium]